MKRAGFPLCTCLIGNFSTPTKKPEVLMMSAGCSFAQQISCGDLFNINGLTFISGPRQCFACCYCCVIPKNLELPCQFAGQVRNESSTSLSDDQMDGNFLPT